MQYLLMQDSALSFFTHFTMLSFEQRSFCPIFSSEDDFAFIAFIVATFPVFSALNNSRARPVLNPETAE
jgi:hypothetical protein